MPTVLLCHCDGTSGSTTFTDVSPSAHTLTATNLTIETTQVKFGTGAANYSGNAYLTVGGTQTDFQFASSPFTIEAWVYATSAPGTVGIFTLFNNGAGDEFFFGTVGGNLVFWYRDGSNAQQSFGSSTTIPTGAWHFMTADRDAGGTLRIYLDGVVAASTSAPTFFNSTLTPLLGNAQYSLAAGWPGYMDEVRVTKGTAIYGGAFTPPTGPFANGGAAAAQARAMVMA